MPYEPIDINKITLDKAASSGFVPVDISSIKLDAPKEAKAAPKKPPAQDFVSRVGRDLAGRSKRQEEIRQAVATGQTPGWLGPIQEAGIVGAGAVGDVAGEAASSLYGMLPENWRQNIEGAGGAAMQAVGSLPSFGGGTIGERIPGELQQLSQQASGFAEQYPNVARTAESLVNIAGVGGGGKGISMAKEAVRESAPVRKFIGAPRREKFVNELILEKETPSVAKQRALSMSDKGVYEPNDFEKSIAAEVGKLPVSKKYTVQKNLNIVKNEAYREAEKLKKSLEKSGVIFPHKEHLAALKRSADELYQSPVITGSDRAKKVADSYINEYEKILRKNGGTPAGLLQSRKDFDRFIGKNKLSKLNAEAADARDLAIKSIRDTTHNFIESKVPDAKLKESLAKQHRLFTARDNMATKIHGERKAIAKKKEARKERLKGAALTVGIGAAGLGGYNVMK